MSGLPPPLSCRASKDGAAANKAVFIQRQAGDFMHRTTHKDLKTRVEGDVQLTTRHVDIHPIVHLPSPAHGAGRRAAAAPGGHRKPGAPLPDTNLQRMAIDNFHELHIAAFGE